jgi:hypothetical protein
MLKGGKFEMLFRNHITVTVLTVAALAVFGLIVG